MVKTLSLFFSVLLFSQMAFAQNNRVIPKNFPDFNDDGVVDEKDLDIHDRILKESLSSKEGTVYSYDSTSGGLKEVEGGVVRIEECSFDLTPSSPCYKKCMRKDGFMGLFGKRNVLKIDKNSCLKCLAGMGIYPTKEGETCVDEKINQPEVKVLDNLSKQLPSKIKKD